MIKHILPALALYTSALCCNAEVIDWEKIEFWSGEGNNKAALVVQFLNTKDSPAPGSVIWGYRWTDGEEPTGEDLLRTVAKESNDLVVMTQFTGSMGSTLNGLGYAASIETLLDNLEYDFDGATQDAKISFGFFEPNTSMQQTSAPGSDAVNLVFEAIDAARETHIIEHPLNQHSYGYPAYDYDWWQLAEKPSQTFWNAGWYKGYWSFWSGGADMADLSYSGLGMSSVYLVDGDVHGWKYMIINEDDMNQDFHQYLDDNSSWLPLNYKHSFTTSDIDILECDSPCGSEVEYYRIDGLRVTTPMRPGMYIRRTPTRISKIIIK